MELPPEVAGSPLPHEVGAVRGAEVEAVRSLFDAERLAAVVVEEDGAGRRDVAADASDRHEHVLVLVASDLVPLVVEADLVEEVAAGEHGDASELRGKRP